MQLVCLIISLLSIPFGTENRFADMILMIMMKFAYPYNLNIHIIYGIENRIRTLMIMTKTINMLINSQ